MTRVVLGIVLMFSLAVMAVASVWNPGAPMGTSRLGHAATLLADGRVLVVGGSDGRNYLATAEIYNPSTNQWTVVASMTSARYLPAATLLPDGRVLVTGGSDATASVETAEIFSPTTGSWTLVAPMGSPRFFHTATLLTNGKVLVTGGWTRGTTFDLYSSTAEVYDPVLNAWSPAGSMSAARVGHPATRLANGRVLIVGGANYAQYEFTADVYDPASNTITSVAPMATRRYAHSADLLPDGRVLVAGGFNFFVNPLASVEIYNPATNSWSAGNSMGQGRRFFTLSALSDGTLLAAGGAASAALESAEIFNSATGTWSAIPSMRGGRSDHAATKLNDGRLLVTGGNTASGATSAVEIWGTAVDNVPPVTTVQALPPPNEFGWNNSPVDLLFQATDAPGGTGVRSVSFSTGGPFETVGGASALTTVTAEGGTTVTFFATDNAGNQEAARAHSVLIDLRPPAISGARSPAPNGKGWNNTNVIATFTCADGLSGVRPGQELQQFSVSSEGAAQSVSAVCRDLAGNSAGAVVADVNIDKSKPTVANVVVTPSAVPVNNAAAVSASLTDAGPSGLDRAEYSVNGGAPALLAAASGVSASVSGPLPVFTSTGVYQVCVISVDRADNRSDSECALLPVYDPTGGFVTGGGWINSPAGAFPANPALTGKATFGFVSKYLPGASVPSGDTQFQFRAADLNFKSTAYDWLVISGARAQYKGTGTINGAGNYGFLLTAVDGDISGGGETDRFRLKVWDAAGIVYDNQMNADDGADPTTVLGGGSIQIHR